MRVFLLALLVACTINAETNKWGADDAEGVSVLNNDNFDEFVKKHNHVFVKFFAPWCGHCKKMAPAYAAMATKFNEAGKDVVIAEVDCTVHNDACAKFGVRGYPTLKFFFNGEPVDYNGDREAESIEKWIETKTSTKVEEVDSKDKITEIANGKLAVVLHAKELSTELRNRFTALAGSYEKIQFYLSTSDAVKDFIKGDDKYNFVVFRNFDDGKKVLSSTEEPTLVQMKEFLDAHRFAAVLEFDEEAAQNIFGGQKTAIFYFSDKEDSEGLKAFSDVANSKKYTDLIFSKSTITGGLGQRLSEYVGVTDKDEGTIRLVKFAGQELNKYKLETTDKTEIEKFLDDFKDGKLKTFLKSEKPVDDSKDDVKTITGDDFEKRVLESDDYVLLEVYAPWCGHCKQLVPIYEKLAKRVKHIKNLVIAKLDGTANEHPSIQVKGFPTIKFYRKGDKQNPLEYAGGRDFEGFMEYLKKELGSDWKDGQDVVDEDL